MKPAMPTHDELALSQLLTRKAGVLYALYDSAQHPRLLPLLQRHRVPHACLYDGVKGVTLANVAPYLIPCQYYAQHPLDFLDAIWQAGVGMLVESGAGVEQVKCQLKKSAFVKNSAGTDCYFRYYDARVFSRLTQVVYVEQLGMLFGNIIDAIYWRDPLSGSVQRVCKNPDPATPFFVEPLI